MIVMMVFVLIMSIVVMGLVTINCILILSVVKVVVNLLEGVSTSTLNQKLKEMAPPPSPLPEDPFEKGKAILDKLQQKRRSPAKK